jgi:hypothetical protein
MSSALVNHEIEAPERAGNNAKPRGLSQSPAARIAFEIFSRLFTAIQDLWKTKRAQKHLRVCESVSLGDKRFVAVIQIDQERFLVGGAANSIAMLTRLAEPSSFSSTMKELTEAGPEIQ